jgi:hypothetical protein
MQGLWAHEQPHALTLSSTKWLELMLLISFPVFFVSVNRDMRIESAKMVRALALVYPE